MADIVLVLGPISFRDFEVPASINLGGKQRVVVHSLPGGARIIDVLGPDDAQINFAGVFSGADATLRARSLNELRSVGAPLALTWDVFFYTVLITELKIDYRNGWWIPFNISCTVLRDEAVVLPSVPMSLPGIIGTDVISAIGYASGAGVDISSLQDSIVGLDLIGLGTENSVALQALIAGARTTIGSAMMNANAVVQGADLAQRVSAQSAATNLLGVTDAMAQLSSLVAAGSYVTRAAVNLANAST